MYGLRYIVIYFILFSSYYQTQALRRIKRGSQTTQNRTAHHELPHELHNNSSGGGSSDLKPQLQPPAKEFEAEHNWAKKAVAAVENAIDRAISSLGHHGATDSKNLKHAPPMHSQLQYINTGAQPLIVAAAAAAAAADVQQHQQPQQQHVNKLIAENDGGNELHKATFAYLLDKRGLGNERIHREHGSLRGADDVVSSGKALQPIMNPDPALSGAFHFHKPTFRSIASSLKRFAGLDSAVGSSQANYMGEMQHNGNINNNRHGNIGEHSNNNNHGNTDSGENVAAASSERQNDKNFSGNGKGNVALHTTAAKLQLHTRADDSNHSSNNVNDVHSINNAPVAGSNNAAAAAAANGDNKKAALVENNGYATAHAAATQQEQQQQQEQHHQQPQQQYQQPQQSPQEQRDQMLKKSFAALLTAQGLPTLEQRQDAHKRQQPPVADNNLQQHQNHQSAQCAAEMQQPKQQQPQLQLQSPAQMFQFGHINGKMLPVESMLKFANMLLYKVGADSPLHTQSAQLSINSNPTGSVISVGPVIEGTDDIDAMDYLYNTFEPKAALLRGPLPAPVPLAPTILSAAATATGAAPATTSLVARPFALLPPFSMAESAQPFNFIENALDMLLSAGEDEGADEEVEIRCPLHHEAKKKATTEGGVGEGAKAAADEATDQEGKNIIQMCSCRFLRKKKNNG